MTVFERRRGASQYDDERLVSKREGCFITVAHNTLCTPCMKDCFARWYLLWREDFTRTLCPHHNLLRYLISLFLCWLRFLYFFIDCVFSEHLIGPTLNFFVETNCCSFILSNPLFYTDEFSDLSFAAKFLLRPALSLACCGVSWSQDNTWSCSYDYLPEQHLHLRVLKVQL